MRLNSIDAVDDVYVLRQGKSSLLVSMPHSGTKIPDWLYSRLTTSAKILPDTDWYLHELYDFLTEIDATVIRANYSRYVIDLNRSSDDMNFYPNSNVTSLCPIDSFNEAAIYQQNMQADSDEIQQRIKHYWQPYHQAIETQLRRIKAEHGRAFLWDAHSIHSRVPRFFDGELAHLNIGTADGSSCLPELTASLAQLIQDEGNYTWVVNDRFKGGFITRHYGRPQQGVNALQMEIAMRTYMNESGGEAVAINNDKARILRPLLKSMMMQCSL